jgi:hypothetical protein
LEAEYKTGTTTRQVETFFLWNSKYYKVTELMQPDILAWLDVDVVAGEGSFFSFMFVFYWFFIICWFFSFVFICIYICFLLSSLLFAFIVRLNFLFRMIYLGKAEYPPFLKVEKDVQGDPDYKTRTHALTNSGKFLSKSQA